MAVDMRKIKKLIELIQSTGVAEIEIREGEESVRITRETKMAPMMMAPPVVMAPNATSSTSEAPIKPEAMTSKPAEPASDKHTIRAPMVGTVYLSPTPG